MFEWTSLYALGLHIQLGHFRSPCSIPEPAPNPFVIIHVNGIHYVHMYFWMCSHVCSPDQVDQLLAFGWYPATVTCPKMCAMFQLLHHSCLQTLQSKHSLVDFYTALEHETNNTGLIPLKVRSPTCSSVLDSGKKESLYFFLTNVQTMEIPFTTQAFWSGPPRWVVYCNKAR